MTVKIVYDETNGVPETLSLFKEKAFVYVVNNNVMKRDIQTGKRNLEKFVLSAFQLGKVVTEGYRKLEINQK